MSLYKGDKYDLDKLLEEKKYAESVMDYHTGFRNHCISLLARDPKEKYTPYIRELNLHRDWGNEFFEGSYAAQGPYAKGGYTNIKAPIIKQNYDRSKLSYVDEIIESFDSDVLAARFVRRESMSQYYIHRDAWSKKTPLFRVQIPLIQNSFCFLVIFENDRIDKYQGWKLEDYMDKESDDYNVHQLKNGFMYHFEVDNKYHTLFNMGEEDRYTLIIDLLDTPKIKEWKERNLLKV